MIANQEETPQRELRGNDKPGEGARSLSYYPTATAHTHDATERFIEALRNVGAKMKGDGRDRWRAQCPAHNGSDLNLSVAKGDQGVLVKCWSHNCTESSIAEAVGLRLSDLFDRDGRALYDYGNGYQIERRRTANGKTVKPVRAGITPELRPLYVPGGSAAIADSATVLLCEGEKTADALVRLGASCAATWAGGAQSAGKADLSPLKGRTVVIVPDNDAPGLEAADKLTRALTGIATEVKRWRVPEKYNDAADLYEDGGSIDDLTTENVELPAEDDEPQMWSPIDMGALIADVIAGNVKTAQPSVLMRTDGSCLFYRGKVNGVHGDSGSGKSWTALYASAQEIRDRHHVIYIDMEDSPADVIARLLALDLPPSDIATFFHYVQPDTPFHTGAEGFLRLIASVSPSLVVIDSTGESLAIEGRNPNADEEIAAWFREVPKRIAKAGPAVVILDHMPKSSDSDLWPIGSQRKRAAIDGAQYLQEVLTPFSKEKAGAARLVCAKDRHGNYARAERVAILHVTPETGAVRLRFEAPENQTPGEFVPTGYMERISRVIEAANVPLGFNGIDERVEGKRNLIRQAVDRLVAGGYVRTQPGPRSSTLHILVKPFREFTDERELVVSENESKSTDDRFRFLEREPGTSHLTGSGNQSGTSGNQSEEVA